MPDTEVLLEPVSTAEVLCYQLMFLLTAVVLTGLDWVMLNLSQP